MKLWHFFVLGVMICLDLMAMGERQGMQFPGTPPNKFNALYYPYLFSKHYRNKRAIFGVAHYYISILKDNSVVINLMKTLKTFKKEDLVATILQTDHLANQTSD